MNTETRVSTQAGEFEVALVSTSEELEAVFAVRMIVFVEEQAVPPEEELDIYDLTATHFLVRLKSPQQASPTNIIASARLVDKGEGTGKIGRVAVLSEHRGKGVGAVMMRFVEASALERDFIQLILEAQLHAIPFYNKLGYAAEGDIFLDAGIEHRLMRKHIGTAPMSAPAPCPIE